MPGEDVDELSVQRGRGGAAVFAIENCHRADWETIDSQWNRSAQTALSGRRRGGLEVALVDLTGFDASPDQARADGNRLDGNIGSGGSDRYEPPSSFIDLENGDAVGTGEADGDDLNFLQDLATPARAVKVIGHGMERLGARDPS